MIGLATALVLQTAIATTGAEPYARAYHTAAETGKSLLVLVGADWCPYCRTTKGALSRLERSGQLDEFVVAHVNTDRDGRLADRLMRGSSIPQMVLFRRTDDGWRRLHVTGGQDEYEIRALIARSAVGE